MLNYFDEWVWSYQLERLLAEVPDGGGTFGEAIEACARMDEGDVNSWYREWSWLGERVRAVGDEADSPVTSRDCYLRAANYFRNANFFLDQDTERAAESYDAIRSSFVNALGTGALDGERVTVETDDGSLTGYYFPATGEGRGDAETALLIHGGADSTKEECYFFGVPRARERGLSCLIFDGYGQGDAIRERDMYTRPDWEASVTPFVDWLDTETDTERIGLLGVSLGGYYGARAAAYEDRLDAVALWSGCYDVIEDVYDYYPKIQGTLQWLVNADSDAEARERLSAFTLDEIPDIDTDLLVIHGGDDTIVDPAAAEKTMEKATNGTLRYWEGTDHCTVEEWTTATTYMFDHLADSLAD